MNKDEMLPRVSVVMPTYNREKHLEKILDSLCRQTYPKDKLEIVIADGYSSDDTIDIAKKYGCIIIQHETIDAEKRRKMAVEKATGDLIFMVDDDNYFPNENILINMVHAMNKENINACECLWQYYDRGDTIANRYCALVGTVDPSTMYLKRQDHMPYFSNGWRSRGNVIKETDEYLVISFGEGEIPTMGMNGFLAKKEDILACAIGDTIMHMEICSYLMENGHKKFIFMKDYFGHDCVTTQKQIISKAERNIKRYNIDGQERRMNYEMSLSKMIKLGLILGTFVIPTKDAIKGFIKVRDVAWFLHPIVSFRIALCYTINTLKKS